MTRTLFAAAAALTLFLGTSGTASAQFYPGLGINPGGYYSGYNPYRGNFTQVTPFGVTQFGNTPYGGSFAVQQGFNPYTGNNFTNRSYFNPFSGRSSFSTGFTNPYTNTYGYQYRYFR